MKYFICPGAQKAGTTSLYDILAKHPLICLTSTKESKYFLNNIKQVNEKDYLNIYFPNLNHQEILGEIDPELIYYPDCAEKIFKTLGKSVQFVFMLRNPVDRAYSHYWMSYRRGFELKSFEDAIIAEHDRLKACSKHNIWHFSYVDRGFYYKQIKRYLKFFNLSQMKFILFEDFIKDQGKFIKDILDFLELDPVQIDLNNLKIKSNVSGLPKSLLLSKIHGQPLKIKKVVKTIFPFRDIRWKIYPLIEKWNISNQRPPQINPETRKNLINKFKEDIKQLEELIQEDLSHWFRIDD